MIYQEKKSIVNSVSSIIITAFYFIYILRNNESLRSVENLNSWGGVILTFILISIGARIVIYIVFDIIYRITSGEKEPSSLDERDKLIELKSTRNSHYVFSLGFVGALTLLALGLPPYSMFLTLTLSGLLSEITGDLSRIFFYRRGY